MSDGEGLYSWQLCVGIQAVSSQSSPASYSMHTWLINCEFIRDSGSHVSSDSPDID